ncbi:MAG: DUF1566 domain-containing protein, partial [Planctomycetes bacterium]|nr:DUF1566 domain-containing protein [Planctomycetota bacterium]
MKPNAKPIIFAVCLLLASSFTAPSAYASPVPDTGQTGDYTSTFGEDSDYNINPRSYTDLGNGIVRDNVTGLEWQQATAPIGACTIEEAVAYSNSLLLGGHDDWRLPDAKELSLLMENSRHGPAIDTTLFSDTVSDCYWSALLGRNEDKRWVANFNDGTVISPSSSNAYVRAVRSGQPAKPYPRFIDRGSHGPVLDQSTGLVWTLHTSSGAYTWGQALSHCENMTPYYYRGYHYWRLPTRNELQSLVSYEYNDPAGYGFCWDASLQTVCFETERVSHWTATADAGSPNKAWVIDFNIGSIPLSASMTEEFNVHCVALGHCGYLGDSDGDGICDDGDASGVPHPLHRCTGFFGRYAAQAHRHHRSLFLGRFQQRRFAGRSGREHRVRKSLTHRRRPELHPQVWRQLRHHRR